MNLSKGDAGFIGVILAVALVFFYAILGLSGMVSALGIILIFIVPTYFILDNFELENDEKIIFSFFISVGVFPSIAYWLGILMSFKLAILITFAILLAAGFLVKKLKKK